MGYTGKLERGTQETRHKSTRLLLKLLRKSLNFVWRQTGVKDLSTPCLCNGGVKACVET